MKPKTSLLATLLKKEPAPGILLLAATLLAMICANSALSHPYENILHYPLGLTLGGQDIRMPVHAWINDALMAVFFLLVGLEIKKEMLIGELAHFNKAILPFIGAIGGMLCPALIYLAFNHTEPSAMRGWAIPSATDIAFAVGVLSLLGNRVPTSLKIFLLALAVIDDLGAVIIIALFYSGNLNIAALLLASLAALILALMGRMKVASILPYLFVGIFLWLAVLQSGVHATIAGVVLGLLIPLRVNNRQGAPLSTALEHSLKPWVNFTIMPIFALANAGVALGGITTQDWLQPVTLGIMAGLFFGKQFGIFAFVWAAIRLGWAHKPQEANWRQIYAVCIVAGIGFTMSLFIGLLAFPSPEWQAHVKLGVLSGSLASAGLGYALLSRFTPKKGPLAEPF